VVATRDPRIKFVVIWAGPAMDYVPELMNEVEENVKASGLSGDELKNALEFKRRALVMLADGPGSAMKPGQNSRCLSVLIAMKNGFLTSANRSIEGGPKRSCT